jgi:hypothetical protein
MAGGSKSGKIQPDSRTKPTKRQGAPNRLGRQHVQKPVSQPLMAPRAEIQVQLRDTIAACEELFKAHGQACSCDCCCLVSNFVGSLRLFHMLLEIT